MTVRESLEFDLRSALGSLAQIDQKLAQSAQTFSAELAKGVGQVARADLGGAAGGLRQVGIAGQEAGRGLEETAKGARNAEQGLRPVEEQTKRTSQGLRTLGVTAGVAFAAVSAGLGVAIAKSAAFEQSISLVGAVSDASARDLDRLREAAIKAGAETIFSAKDAADAQAELAKAGLSTADILGGALRGSLDLAAAGQLGLADAARISAQAMQIFGLRGDDVSHIADVLAAGANKSTASVASLGEGLGNAGGAARLAGLSLEETVGVLALLDQNAVRGAEGGTALRSALIALFTPSKLQREEMQRLGISVFDATGKFVGLERLAGILQERLGGLTDAQRNASLGIIFGTFGIQAATALYKSGAAGVRDYTKAVDDQGAASRFAGKALDNLAGDVEQLRGSIETALIRSGGQATTVLRFLTQSATDTVNALASLPGPVQATAVGLGAVTAGGLGLLAVIGTLAPKINTATDALRNFGKDGSFADKATTLLADKLGLLARGTVALTAFFAIGPQLKGLTGDFVSAGAAAGALAGTMILPGFGTAVGAGIGAIAGAVGLLGDESADAAAKTQRLAGELERLGDKQAFRKFADGAKVTADNAFLFAARLREIAAASPAAAAAVLRGAEAAGITGRAYRQLSDAVDKGTEAYVKQTEKARESDAANRALTNGLGTAAAAQELLTQQMEETRAAQAKYTEELLKGLPTVGSAFDEAVKQTQSYADETKRAFSPDLLVENFKKQLEGVTKWGENLQTLSSLGLSNLVEIFATKGPLASGALLQALIDGDPAIRQQLEDTASGLRTTLEKLGTVIGTSIADQLYRSFYGAGTQAGKGLTEGIVSQQREAQIAAAQFAYSIGQYVNEALEISSPSKVFMRIGERVSEGMAVGIEHGAEKYLDRAGRRLALVPYPTPGRATGGGSPAGTAHVEFAVHVHGVTDPTLARVTGREVVAGADAELAARGLRFARIVREGT